MGATKPVIDVSEPFPVNQEFEDQSFAKAHSICLRIFSEYASRASEGKLNSIRRNRNNWKANAASECADLIYQLDQLLKLKSSQAV